MFNVNNIDLSCQPCWVFGVCQPFYPPLLRQLTPPKSVFRNHTIRNYSGLLHLKNSYIVHAINPLAWSSSTCFSRFKCVWKQDGWQWRYVTKRSQHVTRSTYVMMKTATLRNYVTITVACLQPCIASRATKAHPSLFYGYALAALPKQESITTASYGMDWRSWTTGNHSGRL